MSNRLSLLLASFFYIGKFPLAPGTLASVAGMFLSIWLGGNTAVYILVFLLITLTGFAVSGRIEDITQEKDPSCVVIDEVAGVLFTMIAIPITIHFLIYGFVLFRVLDVVKPPPAKYFDTRLKNGWGIVMDDVVSGIYANIILHLIVATQI